MATNPNTKLNMDDLAAQYGYAASFFNSDAELKALITQAVKEQWTPDKFKAKFMASNWYRTRAADTRTWLELEGRDPAEAADRVNNQLARLQQMTSQMGIAISADRLRQMARDSLMFGWSDQMLTQGLGAEWKYTANGSQGSAATIESQVRQLANDYGVQVSEQQVADWVGGSLGGKYTQDNLTDFVHDMAVSKYPGLKAYLDQGFNVRQVAAPYVQSYSTLLEQSPETVQLNDPLIQQALQGVPDPNKGVLVAQSLYDFEKSLRGDPRWLRTKNAHQQLSNVGLGVLRDMGLYA